MLVDRVLFGRIEYLVSALDCAIAREISAAVTAGGQLRAGGEFGIADMAFAMCPVGRLLTNEREDDFNPKEKAQPAYIERKAMADEKVDLLDLIGEDVPLLTRYLVELQASDRCIGEMIPRLAGAAIIADSIAESKRMLRAALLCQAKACPIAAETETEFAEAIRKIYANFLEAKILSEINGLPRERPHGDWDLMGRGKDTDAVVDAAFVAYSQAVDRGKPKDATRRAARGRIMPWVTVVDQWAEAYAIVWLDRNEVVVECEAAPVDADTIEPISEISGAHQRSMTYSGLQRNEKCKWNATKNI
jgi:hypothetical protein